MLRVWLGGTTIGAAVATRWPNARPSQSIAITIDRDEDSKQPDIVTAIVAII
jgi:hypothetical protein